MHVYHEVDASSLDLILVEGLKVDDRGDNGDDELIVKTDQLLDQHRPKSIAEIPLSRAGCLYAYAAEDSQIVDIVDGQVVPIDDFVAASKGVVLQLTVNTERCFVSDLDIYDEIKSLIEEGRQGESKNLIDDYWRSILPLANFDIGDIERPEVMISYSVEPHNIEVCR